MPSSATPLLRSRMIGTGTRFSWSVSANGRVVRELGDNTLADAILDRLMQTLTGRHEGRIDEKEEK